MYGTNVEGVTFMAVVVLVTTAFVFLLLPYYGTVLWATFVVILFYLLHERLCRWFGGRRNLAAAASVICFVCIVLIPGSIVLGSLADDAGRAVFRQRPDQRTSRGSRADDDVVIGVRERRAPLVLVGTDVVEFVRQRLDTGRGDETRGQGRLDETAPGYPTRDQRAFETLHSFGIAIHS